MCRRRPVYRISIADMNNSDISFSIHDGDLKAGSGTAGLGDAHDL